MQDIMQQLGSLLVGAIPTALLFIVLVFAYQFLVQGPLTAVLARRRALTEGAMEDARKAVAQAEAKAQEYAERLRLARADVYKLREQRVTSPFALDRMLPFWALVFNLREVAQGLKQMESVLLQMA